MHFDDATSKDCNGLKDGYGFNLIYLEQKTRLDECVWDVVGKDCHSKVFNLNLGSKDAQIFAPKLAKIDSD